MATRKPAISTQLKQAQARIAELEKSLATEKQYKEWASNGQKKSDEELDQVHSFFDALPGALPRKSDGEYGSKPNSAMTRLAAWLATKAA